MGSGCVGNRIVQENEVTTTYPIVNVKTVHHDGFLGSSCDYTIVYYKTPALIEQDIVKPCSIGSSPTIHITETNNESVVVISTRSFDKIQEVYVTEETFKNNIW